MLSPGSEPQHASDPAAGPGAQRPIGSPRRRISRRLLVVGASLALIAATAGLGTGWAVGAALGSSSPPVSSTGSPPTRGSSAGRALLPPSGGAGAGEPHGAAGT